MLQRGQGGECIFFDTYVSSEVFVTTLLLTIDRPLQGGEEIGEAGNSERQGQIARLY